MTFNSPHGEENGKYDGPGLVWISEIFVVQDNFFVWGGTLQQCVQSVRVC